MTDLAWEKSEPNGMLVFKHKRADRGGGEVKALVFLHGFFDSLHSWDLVLDALEPIASAPWVDVVYRITLPGWGGASGSDDQYGVGAYAKDVFDMLQADLGAASSFKLVLCGHSMGTLISQRIAQQHPENVIGLVLAGAALAMDPSVVLDPSDGTTCGDLVALFSEWYDKDQVDDEIMRAFQLDDLKGHGVPAKFQDLIMEKTREGSIAAMKLCWASMCDPKEDYSGDTKNIRPDTVTTVIWGTADGVFPEFMQKALMDALPSTSKTLKTVEGAPHGVLWTHPVIVAQEIASVIKKVC